MSVRVAYAVGLWVLSSLSQCGLALALFLGACTTVPHDQEFVSEEGKAYLIVAADDSSKSGVSTIHFQRLDLAKSRFMNGSVSVSFPQGGVLTGDELEKPRDLKTSARFAGTELPPGDYALLWRIDFLNVGLDTTRHWNCLAQGAPVFHIAGGDINVVNAGNAESEWANDSALLRAHVSEVLKGYPKFSAPVGILSPTGKISFGVGENWLGAPTCDPAAGQYQFVPQTKPRP